MNAQGVSALADMQHRAIDLLLRGVGPTEVATELDLDRTTVWRWRTQDESFRAEHERRREEIAKAVRDRLVALVDAAVDVEMKLLLEGDPGAAHTIMKVVGARLLDAALNQSRGEQRTVLDVAASTSPNNEEATVLPIADSRRTATA